MSFAPGPFRPLARQGGGAHFRGLQSPPKGSRGQVGTLVYRSPGSTARVAFVAVSRDSAGAALGGCTMTLLRRTPEGIVLPVATTVSDATGTYRFDDPGTGPFQIRLTKAGTPFVAGLSADTLYPAPMLPTLGTPLSFDFATDENPLGAPWVHGGVTGLDWGNMKALGGNAVGANFSPTGYDDPVACIPSISGDQFVEGVVYIAGGYAPVDNHEIELHLRCTIAANSIITYEVLFNIGTSAFQIVRWLGTIGSFDFTITGTAQNGGMVAPVDGTVIRFQVVGNLFSIFQDGVLKYTFTSSAHTAGGPGIAAFVRPGDTVLANYGWKSITAGSL